MATQDANAPVAGKTKEQLGQYRDTRQRIYGLYILLLFSYHFHKAKAGWEKEDGVAALNVFLFIMPVPLLLRY
jgi:hypothetical protein